eukprot:6185304-Pleurochrysis_carterae.AAC.4
MRASCQPFTVHREKQQQAAVRIGCNLRKRRGTRGGVDSPLRLRHLSAGHYLRLVAFAGEIPLRTLSEFDLVHWCARAMCAASTKQAAPAAVGLVALATLATLVACLA